MRRVRGWLAAVAGLALLAGSVVPASAAARVRTKVEAKSKPKKRTAMRRVAPARPVATLVPVASPAPPATRLAAYRFIDDADGLMSAIGGTTPDFAFESDGAHGFAWATGDGALVIAEPMAADDRRFYFYEPDTTVPFLVRDRLYSFGFERGTWAALYDADGRLIPNVPDGWQARLAADLLARGRQLWFAARMPQPLDRRRDGAGAQAISITLLGDFGRWRDESGRREYRRGPGSERRQERDARYRREHEARTQRPGGAWAGGDPRPLPPRDGTPPIGRRASSDGAWDVRPGAATVAPGMAAPGGRAENRQGVGRPGDARRADTGAGRTRWRADGEASASPAVVAAPADAGPRPRAGDGGRPERGDPAARPMPASVTRAPEPAPAPEPLAAPARPEPAPLPVPRADPPPTPPRELTQAERKQADRAAAQGQEDAPQ